MPQTLETPLSALEAPTAMHMEPWAFVIVQDEAALGLGSCCIGSAVPALNSPDVKAELKIPADVVAVVPIVVGIPEGAPSGVPRKDPEILCWKK